MIYGTDLRNSADAFNPGESLVESIPVGAEDIHNALVSLGILGNGDGGAGLLLDLLDGLSALSDDGADEVGLDLDLLDARNERLVVLTRLADGLHHLTHDVEPALTGLLKSLGENVV